MAEITLNRVTHIEFPNNPEIPTYNLQIESGSLLLDEILCEGNIVFGEANATRFEATVYNLGDVSGLKIKVYQTDTNGNNRKNLFEGFVDSCKQDRNGYYRKVVAYDALYSIGGANVAGWWLQFWTTRETATLRELRNSLCDWVGLSYTASEGLFNDAFVCTKTATLSSVSFLTMLFWICEIQCTIPQIDRDGVLRFISLTDGRTVNITEDYDRGSSEFEGFITAPIDTIELYDYDNNIIASTNSTGAVTSKNIYAIKDNSLLFSLVDAEADANTFVTNYLAQVSQIRYTPCDINMIVSNLDIRLGDWIRIGNITSLVLQNTLSGVLLVEQELQARGDEYLQDSSRSTSAEYLSIEKKTDMMKDEIITDDILNYSYTNKEPYIIEAVVTPVISISIDMPTTSNLVFLATVNLESVSTHTREVRETVILNGEPCEIVRTEKLPVVVESYFEWNGATILSNKPTETYSEDGKHLLNLMFFSIGGRQVGNVSTFKVFITTKHGYITIRENQINATIISKGSSVGNLPWDGTIRIDEEIPQIKIGNFNVILGNIIETISTDEQTPTPSVATDTFGLIAPDFSGITIVGIDESVETTT